ncbi:MAG TPA: hypothetical protein VFH53_06045 [Phycisphaerae bacterium]|nr:hypothetical protein [Phycisphaerae bacterium]HUW99913.1 hypothetical protein [Phycisphaerae bacterium]
MRGVLAIATVVVAFLLAGCGKPADRDAPELGLVIGRVRGVTADLMDHAGRLEKYLNAARNVSVEVRDALRTSAADPSARLDGEAWRASVLAAAKRIESGVLPRIDESLKETEAIQTGIAILEGPVLEELAAAEAQVGELAARTERAEARAERLEREAADAIHKLLVWFIIVGVAGVAGGVAIAVFWKPKLGAGVALGSFFLFGTASVLWRWLNEIQWAMLGLMAIGFLVVVVLLILAIRRNWTSLTEVVEGGEKVKEALEDVGEKVAGRADAAVDYLRSINWRTLFNAAQKSAQSSETSNAVDRIKEAGE